VFSCILDAETRISSGLEESSSNIRNNGSDEMDRIPLHAVVFQSIPESIIILCLGLASIGVRPNLRKMLFAAILSAIASWMIRGLPLPFGLHSIFGLLIIIGLLIVFFKPGILKAVVAGLFAISTLLATEIMLVPFVIKAVGLTGFEEVWGHSLLPGHFAYSGTTFPGWHSIFFI